MSRSATVLLPDPVPPATPIRNGCIDGARYRPARALKAASSPARPASSVPLMASAPASHDTHTATGADAPSKPRRTIKPSAIALAIGGVLAVVTVISGIAGAIEQ